MSYEVLLYYRYTLIEDPAGYMEEQRALCEKLDLRGRILIAHEGINGTVSGLRENTARYRDFMHGQAATADMVFKVDPADAHAFRKLSIRVRPEIVTLGLPESDGVHPVQGQAAGRFLSPRQFYEAMQDPDAIILDGRNNYETALGRFRNAICPDVKHFREFPAWIRNNRQWLKDRPILTYCTGGIRCEKLSVFLIKEGFGDVGQLDGGIVSYGRDEMVRGKDFEGSCYVFDQRIKVSVNRVNPSVISHCVYCQAACDRYRNCRYAPCNAQFICCETCDANHGGRCRPKCGG